MRLIYTYVPFQILLGVLLGIVFSNPNTLLASVLGVSFVLLIVALLLLNKSRKRLGKTYLFFLLVLFFGVLSSWFSQYINNTLNCKNHYQYQLQECNYIELTLVKKLKSTQKYQRFYANVSKMNQQISCGKLLVEVANKNNVDIEIGQIVTCKASVFKIDLPASSYHFDYKAYLERRNVFGKIRLQTYVVKGNASDFLIKIQRFRNNIVLKLENTALSKETKGLMMAMLLGDREGISNETQKYFADAGVVHLIAISGMHVGVLYFLLLTTFGFLKKMKYGKYFHVFLILFCLWIFAVFSGLSSSVVRCVTMFSFIILSKLNDRKTLLLEPIISSALILLWLHPNFLFDAGFQLSYTAVISIVVFYPLITRKHKFSSKITQYFFDVLLVSIIAQLGVLPISLYYFHQFPLQFLVANFFAVSLLPLVLYGGLIVLLKILVFKSYIFIETMFDVFILFYLKIIKKIALWEEWILKDVFFDELYILGYYVLVFCIWRLLIDFKPKNIRWFFASIVIFQLIFLFVGYRKNQKNELIVENNFFNPSVSMIKGNELHVFAKDSLTLNDSKGIKSIVVKNDIEQINLLKNKVFQFEDDYYLIVSEKLNYQEISKKGMVLILRNNPKINLERLIKRLKPKQVIFEAKNYKSNVLTWKSTCKKLQVPCYDVKNNGAFVLTTDF